MTVSYQVFPDLTAAQAFVAKIDAAIGLPSGDTLTWADPLAVYAPAGTYVVIVDDAQIHATLADGSSAFAGSVAWDSGWTKPAAI